MEGRFLLGLRSASGAKGGKSAERGAAESVSHGNRRAANKSLGGGRTGTRGSRARERESKWESKEEANECVESWELRERRREEEE